jgi:hypothetical protein
MIKIYKFARYRRVINAQGLKIQGRGYLEFLPKFLWRGWRFSGKIAREVTLFWVCIFINKCFEICPWVLYLTVPLPLPPPVCIHKESVLGLFNLHFSV